MKAKINYLSKEDQDRIHRQSCEFLKSRGIVVTSSALIDELQLLGLEVIGNRLRFPAPLIDKVFAIIKKAANDGGNPKMGKTSFSANRGFTSLVVDETTKEYRKVKENDIRDLCNVVNTLSDVDYISLPFTDDEVLTLGMAAKQSNKPILTPCSTKKSLEKMYRLPCHFSAFFFMEGRNLNYDDELCQMLLLAAKKKISYGIIPAEVDLKNHTLSELILLFNIHNLAILLITKLLQRKSDVLYCGIPFFHADVEQHIFLNTALSEMAGYYRQKTLLFGDVYEKRVFSQVSGFENYMNIQCLESAVENAILVGIGSVGCGDAYSLSNAILDQEALTMSQGFQREFEVDAEHLGVDVIEDVGPGGHFLFHPHTLKHFSHEIWRKKTEDSFIFQGQQTYQKQIEERLNAIINHKD